MGASFPLCLTLHNYVGLPCLKSTLWNLKPDHNYILPAFPDWLWFNGRDKSLGPTWSWLDPLLPFDMLCPACKLKAVINRSDYCWSQGPQGSVAVGRKGGVQRSGAFGGVRVWHLGEMGVQIKWNHIRIFSRCCCGWKGESWGGGVKLPNLRP